MLVGYVLRKRYILIIGLLGSGPGGGVYSTLGSVNGGRRYDW